VGQHCLGQGLVLIGMAVNDLGSCIETAFKGYIDAFLESMRRSQAGYSESTLLAYQTDLEHFDRFLNRSLGHLPLLADFNADNATLFLESEKSAGRKRSTLVRRRAVLRSLAAYLNTTGIIMADFFSSEANRINLPIDSTHPSKDRQVLAQAEIETIFQAMEASKRPRARRDQAILGLMLETAMSVGKLAALNLADVRSRQNQWHIHLSSWNKWLLVVSSAQYLKHYLEEGRPELNPLPDEPALFISQTGRRIDRQGIWQVLVYWGKVSGLRISLSPRLVRNTAVKKLIELERPISEIKQLLGHTNHLSTRAMVRRLELNQSESTKKHGE
jgi:integrase/recombinase XerD